MAADSFTENFLAGRNALVTGGGTGIGRAIALRLARHGARVALFGRREEPLRATAEEAGDDHLWRSLDVRDRAAVDRCFAEAADRMGPLHILVANAGIGGPDVWEGRDRFDEIVRTNIDGAYFSVRAFQRHVASGPDPRHILVISSCVARFGVAGIAAYSAAKSGQLGLVRSLAMELAPEQIRVNAICPGWVETGMAEARMTELGQMEGRGYGETRAALLAEVPLDRITEPEEIAGIAAFLCSPDARAFTGQAFDPNDGQWMG